MFVTIDDLNKQKARLNATLEVAEKATISTQARSSKNVQKLFLDAAFEAKCLSTLLEQISSEVI